MASSKPKKKQKPVSFGFILEPLENLSSYVKTKMFGCEAAYFYGRLMLVLAEHRDADWRGLLIPTYHEFHSSLRREFKALEIHPILKKWLYLRLDSDDFETNAMELVSAAKKNDKRFGVEPSNKSKGIK